MQRGDTPIFSNQTKLSILKAIVTKKSPYYIQYYINSRCTLRCKQCNIVETNSGLRELPLSKIETVAKNIVKIGGGIVLLTGGEPFLREDLPEIVRIFRSNKLDVRLQTWGEAPTHMLEKCYANGARDLNISLDSLVEDKQDYINSVPGTWRRAIDAISRVSNVFSDASAICSLGCVLSRFNFREIPAILEFATSIGWYLSLVPVHIANQSEFYGFRSFDEKFRFRNEDWPELERVLNQVKEMKRNGYLLFDAESYLDSSFNFLKTGRPTWRKNDVCDSPNLYFAIRPNGDFMTCCDHIMPQAPNLADDNFPELYKTGVVQKMAQPIVKSCSGCHYGSYPEVTISVRDYKALFQRTSMVLFRKRKLIKPKSTEELLSLIQTIKDKHDSAYSAEGSLGEDIDQELSKWSNLATRRSVITADNARRKAEGRIRKIHTNSEVKTADAGATNAVDPPTNEQVSSDS